MPNLIGTAPNQVPTNGSLGNMAFQNKEGVITDLLSTTALTVTGTGVMSVGGTQIYKDASGNVGIGTSSPSFKLDVQGNSASVATFVRSRNGDTSATSFAGYGCSTGEGVDAQWYSYSSANWFGTKTNHPQLFITNNTERLRITTTGSVGIGTSSPPAQQTLTAGRNMTGSTFSSGVASTGQVQSDATSRADYFISVSSVAAGTYSRVVGYQAQQGTITGTVNNQYGFQADASLIGATSNMGFFGNIPDGTNRWNFYAQGTAPNYFAGNVGIGTASPGAKLDVSGSAVNFTNSSGSFDFNVTGTVVSTMRYITSGTGYGDWRIQTGNTASGLSGAIRFFDVVANAERMRIDASGNLLVGTTSASTSSSSGVKVLPAEGGANNPQLSIVTSASTATTASLAIYSTGASALRFYVDNGGTIYATNTSISAISDQRFKENVRDLDTGLDTILALKPRRFDWKEGKGKDVKDDMGFIAQEVETVLPALVGGWKAGEGEPDDLKSVKAGDLIPVLVKAIQELTARVAQLEGN